MNQSVNQSIGPMACRPPFNIQRATAPTTLRPGITSPLATTRGTTPTSGPRSSPWTSSRPFARQQRRRRRTTTTPARRAGASTRAWGGGIGMPSSAPAPPSQAWTCCAPSSAASPPSTRGWRLGRRQLQQGSSSRGGGDKGFGWPKGGWHSKDSLCCGVRARVAAVSKYCPPFLSFTRISPLFSVFGFRHFDSSHKSRAVATDEPF